LIINKSKQSMLFNVCMSGLICPPAGMFSVLSSCEFSSEM